MSTTVTKTVVPLDQDGKSQTASAVDARSYPEQNSPRHQALSDQIAARAYELWQQRGCPVGSPDCDWLEAQRELNANVLTREDLRQHREEIGSVQK